MLLKEAEKKKERQHNNFAYGNVMCQYAIVADYYSIPNISYFFVSVVWPCVRDCGFPSQQFFLFFIFKSLV